jgi:hypothetical protein
MRLRIFDLNTPWFWLIFFFQRNYSKPWLELSLWTPHTFQKWWIHVWQWEKIPDERGAYAVEKTESEFTAVEP